MWSNIILGAILLAIVAAVSVYLYRAKKRGETCIGCPYAKQCGSGSCGGHSRSTLKHNQHTHP